MRPFVILALTALLAACAGAPKELVEGPYYTEGFSDGCRTAEARRAAFDNRSFRNEELFRLQPSYAAGWRQGFAECQPPPIVGPQPTSPGSVEPVL
ncbi:hypothetical protein [Parvularcula lutaonensis]|uniref:Lipoprotein n=1 Tax=Parvularcula lutaonensis TaxID=491923 RepID=A0ABV7MFQ7_9PROT|nr:hypothetical protein [Parvularcula lutaonensis]GGY54817.1 hypothetical protein GCM10007148_25690 [Parvularcula lutaonensis]